MLCGFLCVNKARAQSPEDTTVWMFALYDARIFPGVMDSILCSDIRRGKYTLPDGSVKRGRTAWVMIRPSNRELYVGKGSEFDWDGHHWKVTRVRRTSIWGRYVHGNVYITAIQ